MWMPPLLDVRHPGADLAVHHQVVGRGQPEPGPRRRRQPARQPRVEDAERPDAVLVEQRGVAPPLRTRLARQEARPRGGRELGDVAPFGLERRARGLQARQPPGTMLAQARRHQPSLAAPPVTLGAPSSPAGPVMIDAYKTAPPPRHQVAGGGGGPVIGQLGRLAFRNARHIRRLGGTHAHPTSSSRRGRKYGERGSR